MSGIGDKEDDDIVIPGSRANRNAKRKGIANESASDVVSKRQHLDDPGMLESVDLIGQADASPLAAQTRQTEMHAAMSTAAEEQGLEYTVDTHIHEGKTENKKHETAFITSLVPDQKSQIRHKGLVPTTVQPPAEQTRISIKVYTDKLDPESTKVLEQTVQNHTFYIKAKSEAAIMKFINKCKDSGVITTLDFDPKVCPPGVVFTKEQTERITKALSEAKAAYLHKENPRL